MIELRSIYCYPKIHQALRNRAKKSKMKITKVLNEILEVELKSELNELN